MVIKNPFEKEEKKFIKTIRIDKSMPTLSNEESIQLEEIPIPDQPVTELRSTDININPNEPIKN